MVDKKYCNECKHFRDVYVPGCGHKKLISYADLPEERIRILADCSTRNEKNDCKYFEQASWLYKIYRGFL